MAWRRPDADFKTVRIPGPERRLRRPGQSCLFDPGTERDAIDYLTFHSESVAEALTYFCGVAKRTLARLGRRKVIGAFYGYHFKNLNLPAHFHNTGHCAQQTVLDCPHVDFVCAPYCYQGREPGHMYLAQLVAGSVRLQEKLYWCEEDTFTFLSKRDPGRSWCPDRGGSIGVLRRNLMGILRDGGTAWWMDCGSPGHGPQVEGWYRDEGLMQNFAFLQRLAADRLHATDHSPTTQVAVFVSDRSAVYQRQDAALMDALVMRLMFEIGSLGAPFDTYRVADLELLFGKLWSANYRLLLFLDALWLSEGERSALRNKVCNDGRMILWTYAAGLVTEAGLDVGAMEDATGIRVALRREEEAVMVNTFLSGSRMLYGTERPLSPVMYGADPRAEVLGWLLNSGDPGLLRRRFPAWCSVWSAAPAVSAPVLRRLAVEAGFHLYLDTGEQIMAENGYLAVHAGFDGERLVRLPARSDVVEADSGRVTERGAIELRVSMPGGNAPLARDPAGWLGGG